MTLVLIPGDVDEVTKRLREVLTFLLLKRETFLLCDVLASLLGNLFSPDREMIEGETGVTGDLLSCADSLLQSLAGGAHLVTTHLDVLSGAGVNKLDIVDP